MKLLFVCLGNICRSPSAEAVMNHLIESEGLENKISCDSAGTIGYHAGSRADSRMIQHGSKRGYHLDSISRKVTVADFNKLHYIIAMDRSNYQDLKQIAPSGPSKAKLVQMCDYSTNSACSEIPDPYYGGADGFEKVLELLEDCCQNLLTALKQELE